MSFLKCAGQHFSYPPREQCTVKAGRTYFFSSSLDITKRVKFLSSMKPMSNAMAPPTAEAMMMVSVLSTTFTAMPKDHHHKSKSIRVFSARVKMPQKCSLSLTYIFTLIIKLALPHHHWITGCESCLFGALLHFQLTTSSNFIFTRL